MVNKQLTEPLTAKILVTRLNYRRPATTKGAGTGLTLPSRRVIRALICNRGTHHRFPLKNPENAFTASRNGDKSERYLFLPRNGGQDRHGGVWCCRIRGYGRRSIAWLNGTT